MTQADITRWAKEIEAQLTPYQNEAHYRFESCFNEYTAQVTWTCDIVCDEGDYYTSPSWHSKNERLDISVMDADGTERVDISSDLVKFFTLLL